ncbi:MAG TPA: HAMP domain-containing sensor histidine kinase [Salinivirgaceae bacterium]|nr:HAMP domain-containing sensor histidine kinase [Salinivirgaceae bacterium]
MEFNLQNALEKAQENEQIKASFLRAMNHEIRTPLNGIVGFTQLLLSKVSNYHEVQHYFGFINSCNQRLVEIIENILDLSLIENRQMDIHISEFDLNEVIDACVEKYAQQIEPGTIKFIINKSMANEPCGVVSDRTKISKIIQHLLSNAIKFTHKGFVELKVTEEKDQIIISVKDTGIGIDPKHQAIIFDRFRQIDMDSTRRYEGSGIGLTLVKEFVTMLKGEINLYSELNHGSQFIVSLPKRIENEVKNTTSKVLFTQT